MQLDSDGQAQVEFFSSDATVDYEAIVEGVTDDGEIIQADEFIPNNTSAGYFFSNKYFNLSSLLMRSISRRIISSTSVLIRI